MASITERPGKKGPSFLLRWRFNGAPDSMTLRTREQAEVWKAVLEANGHSLAAAQRAMDNAHIGGPTVVQLLHKHVSLLTGVGGDQLGRYKKAITHHFAGTALGRLPVAAVTYEDVILWVKEMQAKPGRKAGTTMAAKTLANHHGLLSAAFATAELLGYRDGNPCEVMAGNTELPSRRRAAGPPVESLPSATAHVASRRAQCSNSWRAHVNGVPGRGAVGDTLHKIFARATLAALYVSEGWSAATSRSISVMRADMYSGHRSGSTVSGLPWKSYIVPGMSLTVTPYRLRIFLARPAGTSVSKYWRGRNTSTSSVCDTRIVPDGSVRSFVSSPNPVASTLVRARASDFWCRLAVVPMEVVNSVA